MIDDTVTEEEKQELGDVNSAVYATLDKLRSELADTLCCDEIDINLEVRWDVTDVNSWAEYGYPTYCWTTLTHGKLALPHHEWDVLAWKLLPAEEADDGRTA
jgi:hypothetical protein